MILCKEQYTSEFLSLIKPASRISSVFVIPENSGFKIGKDVYYNFYSKKIKHNKKVFYLRNFGGEFCITPYYLFIKNPRGTIYSIGEGIYKNKETKNLLLIESFNKDGEIPFNIERIIKYIEKIDCIVDFDIVRTDRWGCSWINISVLQK